MNSKHYIDHLKMFGIRFQKKPETSLYYRSNEAYVNT